MNAWLFALKPKSWPKILVPFVLGNALGARYAPEVVWALWWGGGLAVVLGIAFIVLLNDWADERVDTLKRRMFPHAGSPKTIPDGILPAQHLLWAGVASGLVAFALIVYVGLSLPDRPLTLHFAVVSCLFFVAYTLPPVRLNYRGGGELLEMLGVGYCLPWFMAYLHTGELWLPGLHPVLISYSLFSLSSAIASGLSDEESDRAGGKRTVVTTFGNRWAHRMIAGTYLAGALFGGALPFIWHDVPPAVLIVQVPLWFYFGNMQTWAPLATTNAFAEQSKFKSALHQGIWLFGLAFAAIFLVDSV